jgi:cysteinyl-tRNA synthetase
VRATELEQFVATMDDDLATPRALARLLTGVRRANALLDTGELGEGRALARVVLELLGVLGIVPVTGAEVPPEAVRAAAEARESARRAKDYAAADRLRDEIVAQGWQVEDTATGWRLVR